MLSAGILSLGNHAQHWLLYDTEEIPNEEIEWCKPYASKSTVSVGYEWVEIYGLAICVALLACLTKLSGPTQTQMQPRYKHRYKHAQKYPHKVHAKKQV